MIDSAFATLAQLAALGKKRKLKEEVLTAASENPVLRTLFRATYDWLVTYGIKVDPVRDGIDAAPGPAEEANFKTFLRVLEAYSTRRLTGNDARRAWMLFLQRCSPRERLWYSRVVNRDLRIDTSYSTIGKVWPDLLSNFGAQLANKLVDIPDGDLDLSHRLPYWKWPVWVEPKMNGLRALIVVRDGRGTAYSREAHALPNLQHFADHFAELQGLKKLPDFVVDGEAIAIRRGERNESWNAASSLFMTNPENMTEAQRTDLLACGYYIAFDYMTYEEFQDGGCDLPMRIRRRNLKSVMSGMDPQIHMRTIQHEIAESMAEVQQLYETLLRKGFEGAMIKYPGAPYQQIRTNNWLKVVPEETIDVEIIGVLPGDAGKRNEGTVGRLLVRDPHGFEWKVANFTDAARAELEALAADGDLIGRVIEVKMKTQQQQTGKVLHPVYSRLRTDKTKVTDGHSEDRA